MSEREVAGGGMRVRRRFERSRLEQDLFEAVYEVLLVEPASDSGAVERSVPTAALPAEAASVAA